MFRALNYTSAMQMYERLAKYALRFNEFNF